MRKNTIKINANFEWEISKRDWTDLKLHQKTVEKDIQNKLEYDPTFVFHIMNDISVPSLKGLKINGQTKKVKL